MTDLDSIGAAELFDRARHHLLARDTAAADRLLRQGRIRAPGDSAMAYLHGLCHTMSGASADAAEAFEEAFRLDPDDGRTALLLSRALRSAGRQADSARVRAGLVRRHAGDPVLLNEVATELLEEGDEPAAASLLEQALAIAPDDPGILHNLGVACARIGSLERAESLLRRAADRQAAGTPAAAAVHAALAGVLATRGFPNEALEIAQGLIAASQEPVHAWTVVGTVAARRRLGRDAVAAFLEAERIEPDNPNVLSNLATALDDAGRQEEAALRWNRLAATGHAEAGERVRLGSGTPAAGEAVRRLFALSDSVPEDGGPLDLREVDLCIDQWHLIDGDRMALDLVFTPPLGRDNFVLLPGRGTSLVRDDLPRERIDEPVLFLGGTGNYYHWMLDTLPRLAAAGDGVGEGAGDVDGDGPPLLVNRAPTAFQRRTLQLMGLDLRRLMVPQAPALTRFARLSIPGLVSRPRRHDGQMDWMIPSVNAQAAHWVRERLMAGLRTGHGGARRILISREGSLFRRCENEAAIADIAVRHGFVPVRLEDLTFDAQVGLFSGAEIVMGIHGAGFTNMLFAPAGALLIELHPAGHLPVFYRHLTGLMGQRHMAIPGTITQSLHPSLEYNWNFRVDPADVDLFLAEL
jgi:capsular polysaccharide biosynthesis protein/Flp pilus assembly protein TadD